MKQGDAQGLVLLVGMLAVIFGVAFLVPRTTAPQAFSPVEMATAAVTVGQPTADGLPVTFTTETPGFVSLHRAMGDAPGEILGQVHVEAGENQSVVLPTSGAVGPAIVLLFADDGDGMFEAGVDRPIVRDGASVRGEVVLSQPDL